MKTLPEHITDEKKKKKKNNAELEKLSAETFLWNLSHYVTTKTVPRR